MLKLYVTKTLLLKLNFLSSKLIEKQYRGEESTVNRQILRLRG